MDTQKRHASKKKHKHITKSGVVVELTPQQKAYADAKLQAKAGTPLIASAKQAYPNAGYDTLRQIVAQNEKNQSIAIYSNEQLNRAKTRVVELVESDREDIALRASQDILDRTEGKPIQKQEITQKSVSISIDLSGNGLAEPKTEE